MDNQEHPAEIVVGLVMPEQMVMEPPIRGMVLTQVAVLVFLPVQEAQLGQAVTQEGLDRATEDLHWPALMVVLAVEALDQTVITTGTKLVVVAILVVIMPTMLGKAAAADPFMRLQFLMQSFMAQEVLQIMDMDMFTSLYPLRNQKNLRNQKSHRHILKQEQ